MKTLVPTDYGLPAKTVLEQHGEAISIVIDRKSRIIMADGQKILAKVSTLRSYFPKSKFSLRTTAPVCSKTKLVFKENGILLIEMS